MTTKGWEKVVAFGCVHTPLHSEKAVKELLQIIKAEKPDHLVCLGDLIEADAASRWGSELKHDLLDEFEGTNELLKRLRARAGGARLHLTEGNHDDNTKRENRINQKVRRLARMEKWVPELTHWETVPYINHPKYTLKIGQFTLFHGFRTGRNSDHQHSVEFGVDYGVTISAHTHRIQPLQRTELMGIHMNRWNCNVGCLIDIPFFKENHYPRRDNTLGWAHGVFVGSCNPRRRHFGSKQWSGGIVELRD